MVRQYSTTLLKLGGHQKNTVVLDVAAAGAERKFCKEDAVLSRQKTQCPALEVQVSAMSRCVGVDSA